MDHFLRRAALLVPFINESVSWHGAGGLEDGEVMEIPLERYSGRSALVARPLLGHSLRIPSRRDTDGAGAPAGVEGADSAGAGEGDGGAAPAGRAAGHRPWGGWGSLLRCVGRGDGPSAEATRRITNASEIWPGLVMSGVPMEGQRYAFDWLGAMQAARVGLVIDLRTPAELQEHRWADCLVPSSLRSQGMSAMLAVEPVPPRQRTPSPIEADAEMPAARTLAMTLVGADRAVRQHSLQVLRIPLGAAEMASTAFLLDMAHKALALQGGVPSHYASRPGRQGCSGVVPVSEARVGDGAGGDPGPAALPPTVVVQTPLGLGRGAPVLMAIRLLQLHLHKPSCHGQAERVAMRLAAELRQARGPSMVWSPHQFAPVLALADRLLGNAPAFRHAPRGDVSGLRRGADGAGPVTPQRRPPLCPPRAGAHRPAKGPGFTQAQRFASLLVQRRREQVLGADEITPLALQDPDGTGAPDGAPPRPAGPPSRKA